MLDTSTLTGFDKHSSRIERDYFQSLKERPYFCDELLPYDMRDANAKERITEKALPLVREIILRDADDGSLCWDMLITCELLEATKAIADSDPNAAVEALYKAAAGLLRTIDILEDRQSLGIPVASKPQAEIVKFPDDTEVWVVYRNLDRLVTYKRKTWLGTVPMDLGPRQVEIELYSDHTTSSHTDIRYIMPVAWFYTEAEARTYIETHPIAKQEKGEGE